MSMTLRVAAATKATAAAQEARPARAMGLPAMETAWARNGEERAPTSASRFTRDAKVMASCPTLEKVRMRRTSPRASARRVCKALLPARELAKWRQITARQPQTHSIGNSSGAGGENVPTAQSDYLINMAATSAAAWKIEKVCQHEPTLAKSVQA